MPVKLSTLIAKTEASLRTETDPAKYSLLAMDLATYTKAAKDCDDDEEDDDEDEKAKKAKAAAALAAKKPEEKKPEGKAEDDDDEAKAALALVQTATGMTGKRALGAMSAIVATAQQNTARIAALEQNTVESRRASLIKDNAGKYLTKTECTWLASQPVETVEGFVEMRHKAGVIVHTDDTTIARPKVVAPDSEEALPQYTRDLIEQTVASAPVADKVSFRKLLVANHLKAHHERMNAALNGAGRI